MLMFGFAVFLVALLYSMVGHGGASGYLAAGTFAGLPLQALKAQALVLNVLVAGLAAFSFSRAGYFRPRLLLPLILGSVPAAYWAAGWHLDPKLADKTLGFCLAFAALNLFGRAWLERRAVHDAEVKPASVAVLCLAGLVLGLVSGLTGVGGGIYLSPLLLLAGWASLRETAATSAWFIVLNSLSALAALWRAGSGSGLGDLHPAWLTAALAGGLVGSFLGARRLQVPSLRVALGAVLSLASVRLLLPV
jgi:uncharacterized membrane protein YfcA